MFAAEEPAANAEGDDAEEEACDEYPRIVVTLFALAVQAEITFRIKRVRHRSVAIVRSRSVGRVALVVPDGAEGAAGGIEALTTPPRLPGHGIGLLDAPRLGLGFAAECLALD